jgi:hypothetical protein
MEKRALNASSENNAHDVIKDLNIEGDPYRWRLVCKAWSEAQGWMKSTKAMDVPGSGVLIQVTTRETGADGHIAIAEAVTFVPMTFLMDREDGCVELCAMVATGQTMDLSAFAGKLAPDYLETPG